MDRINEILHHKLFKKYLKKNEKLEKGRIFCHHDFSHLLDVARIAYIIKLEKQLNYSKDIIYGTALLHDIGRWLQYKEGVPHEKAGGELAVEILKDCYFDNSEIETIVTAILKHREESEDEQSLNHLIFYSDKASRGCFNCKAADKCNWSDEKKNFNIKY